MRCLSNYYNFLAPQSLKSLKELEITAHGSQWGRRYVLLKSNVRPSIFWNFRESFWNIWFRNQIPRAEESFETNNVNHFGISDHGIRFQDQGNPLLELMRIIMESLTMESDSKTRGIFCITYENQYGISDWSIRFQGESFASDENHYAGISDWEIR